MINTKEDRLKQFLKNNPKHFILKERAKRKEIKKVKLIHRKRVQRVLKLRSKGLSIRKISKKVTIKRTAVFSIIKKYETKNKFNTI